MGNFWRLLSLPLINCETELELKWTKNCVISEISRTFRAVDPNANSVVHQLETTTTSETFQINDDKLYAAVVRLSINDNIKVLENIKQGFKRTICCNKYRSEITTQPKNNNLDYVIDQTFRNNDDPTRYSFDQCYMPLVEIKDFSALIDNKPFFDQRVKNKHEAY